ncbi:MAG TPA: cytochrome c [Gammaproteobacteria bacterium]|jgi:mono/diheme cytochrome c family protein|nr:cytochrome c [Gammaproteobacteria bacterium]
MSVRHATLPLVLACLAAASAHAQPSAERGKAKFEHTCAPCHGKGGGNDGHAQLPGTEALAIKYKGTIPAALEDRSDLTADTIRAFVRNGSFSMPPFRPTELTNAEIADIAAYLAVSSKRR